MVAGDIKTCCKTKCRKDCFTQEEVLATMFDTQVYRFLSILPLLDAFQAIFFSYSLNKSFCQKKTAPKMRQLFLFIEFILVEFIS